MEHWDKKGQKFPNLLKNLVLLIDERLTDTKSDSAVFLFLYLCLRYSLFSGYIEVNTLLEITFSDNN